METYEDIMRRWLGILMAYLKASRVYGFTPMMGSVRLYARMMREFRIAHKFYDCV